VLQESSGVEQWKASYLKRGIAKKPEVAAAAEQEESKKAVCPGDAKTTMEIEDDDEVTVVSTDPAASYSEVKVGVKRLSNEAPIFDFDVTDTKRQKVQL